MCQVEVVVRVVFDLPKDERPDLLPNPVYLDRERSILIRDLLFGDGKDSVPTAAV